MSLWQASTTVKAKKIVHDDDDWDTDPSFVNNISEKDQRWGNQKTLDLDENDEKTCEELAGLGGSQLRDAILKMQDSGKKASSHIEQSKREYQTPGIDQTTK
ncbi:hypothetical protein HDU67_001184 [Dinochytrium kinnereticum]|nr:hypothetical protein HDU67_001184 [Dinochytrium kinnereticum]